MRTQNMYRSRQTVLKFHTKKRSRKHGTHHVIWNGISLWSDIPNQLGELPFQFTNFASKNWM